MKLRSLKLLMVAILIMQTITFTSVFADTNSTDSSPVLYYDFSGTKLYDNTDNVIDGVADKAVVYGQYGKDVDDASLRLYTTTGNISSKQEVRYDPKITLNADEYVHISFEYLREDYHSGLLFDLSYRCESDGILRYDDTVIDCNLNHQNWFNKIRTFVGTGQSDVTYSLGNWRKIDAYFSASSGTATLFVNGVKRTSNLSNNPSWNSTDKDTQNPLASYDGIRYLDRIRFSHVHDKASNTTPSAIQLDNILVEKVNEVPNTVSGVTYGSGEKLDFDRHIALHQHDDGYWQYGTTYWNSKNITAGIYNGYSGAVPAVNLGQRGSTVSLENGVFGKEQWNKSFHRVIPAGSTQNMTWYDPSVTNLAVGDTAYLTFNVANSAADVDFTAYSNYPKFSDGTNLTRTELFQMTASDKKVRVFQKNTNVIWQPNTWYKVDMIINVKEDGTYVDCYLNGNLISQDNIWNGTKALTSINQVAFTNVGGSDYYLDDIAYNRITSNSINDILNGCSLTDTDDTYINNDEKVIAISSDVPIADFVNLLSEKKNVTVYNENGIIHYKGTLSSASTVKVSKGFGTDTYYNVGYKTDKLAIGDITYDADAKELKSQAEVGFTIRENFNEVTAPIQTAGTIIIALYDGNELVGCMPYNYTGLTENAAKEVTLSNVESVQGKTVKVFIFNSESDITPLVVNKVKSDF